METCPKCGAHVGQGMTWCGQCFAPLGEQEPQPQRAVAPWQRLRAEETPVEPVEFSRWRGGPTHFGPTGRIVLSVGVVLGLVVCFPLLQGLMFAVVGVTVPTKDLLLLYLGVAIPGGLYLMSRVWKRVRVA